MLALAFSGFDLAKDLTSMIGSRSRRGAAQRREETRHVLHVLLPAGGGRPARTPFGFLVRALPVVVPATKCGVCCLSLVGPRICWRVRGTGEMPVEALFPQGGGCIELASSSGWSRVLRIDAVGGPPHCDFANQGGWEASPLQPRLAARYLGRRDLGPARRGRRQVGIALPGSPPEGIGMER